jgi:hypothetical protein
MPFPNDRRYPLELPLFLLNDHTLAAGERVEDAEYEQGEDRRRDLRTFTPWIASVATRLSQSEFDDFHAWHENVIDGGTQYFDVQVHSLVGGAPQWWEGMILGDVRRRALGARYLVSFNLFLRDGPYDEREAPTLRARVLNDSGASGVLVADATLRARVSADSGLGARVFVPPTILGQVPADSGVAGELEEP